MLYANSKYSLSTRCKRNPSPSFFFSVRTIFILNQKNSFVSNISTSYLLFWHSGGLVNCQWAIQDKLCPSHRGVWISWVFFVLFCFVFVFVFCFLFLFLFLFCFVFVCLFVVLFDLFDKINWFPRFFFFSKKKSIFTRIFQEKIHAGIKKSRLF